MLLILATIRRSPNKALDGPGGPDAKHPFIHPLDSTPLPPLFESNFISHPLFGRGTSLQISKVPTQMGYRGLGLAGAPPFPLSPGLPRSRLGQARTSHPLPLVLPFRSGLPRYKRKRHLPLHEPRDLSSLSKHTANNSNSQDPLLTTTLPLTRLLDNTRVNLTTTLLPLQHHHNQYNGPHFSLRNARPEALSAPSLPRPSSQPASSSAAEQGLSGARKDNSSIGDTTVAPRHYYFNSTLRFTCLAWMLARAAGHSPNCACH